VAVWNRAWFICVPLIGVILGHWSLLLHGKHKLIRFNSFALLADLGKLDIISAPKRGRRCRGHKFETRQNFVYITQPTSDQAAWQNDRLQQA
ncbi:hypothetical protein C8R47DRAFT_1323675, partial [Mycena vitilis]